MSLGKDVGIGKQDLVYVRLSINFVSERSAIRDQLCPYLCLLRHIYPPAWVSVLVVLATPAVHSTA